MIAAGALPDIGIAGPVNARRGATDTASGEKAKDSEIQDGPAAGPDRVPDLSSFVLNFHKECFPAPQKPVSLPGSKN